jgi:hypothetical protein
MLASLEELQGLRNATTELTNYLNLQHLQSAHRKRELLGLSFLRSENLCFKRRNW